MPRDLHRDTGSWLRRHDRVQHSRSGSPPSDYNGGLSPLDDSSDGWSPDQGWQASVGSPSSDFIGRSSHVSSDPSRQGLRPAMQLPVGAPGATGCPSLNAAPALSDDPTMLPLFGDLGSIEQAPVSAGGSGGSGGNGSSVSPTSGSGSAFVINVSYDSSVSSAPAGFEAAIQDAIAYLESVIFTPVTVNIDVGYGEIDNVALESGALGESEAILQSYSYSSIKSALQSVDPSAARSLPSSAPGTMWLSTAQAKALELAGASSNIDGYAGFSSVYPFTYDPNNRAVSGDYDFIGVVEHEFTEDLGRIDLFGSTIGQTPNSYSLLDLYHYTSAGAHTYTGTPTNYFSVDGGNTALDYFNSDPSGDFGDWASSAGADSFLAFSPSGEANTVSQADLTELAALGFSTLAPPTVAATSPTVSDNQSVALSSIFSVNGSGITQYQVWFSWPQGGFPALGSVTNNGTAIAQDQAVTLSSLVNLDYTGGATPGTDRLLLRAYDGTWSNWATAMITDPGVTSPTVTATSPTVSDNQSVALSSIFSLSGSGITQYRVWFSWPQGGFPALGSITNNGIAIAQDLAVTVSSLANLDYIGGATPGTDRLLLRAYDGTWSNWAAAMITDPGVTPPTVTATSPTVSNNQSVALSSIFSVSGSGITQYQVWFGWPQGGFPALGSVTNNGTAIAQDQAVTVSSLADLDYIGGATPGTDRLLLRAYDGTWSNWAASLITDPGAAASSAGSAVSVTGASDTLAFDGASCFAGAVAGLANSGTAAGGMPSSSDGAANIALLSDYLASAFVAHSDLSAGNSPVLQPSEPSANNPTLVQLAHA